MEIEEGGFTEYKVWREPVSSKSIPLYTHPAKTIWCACGDGITPDSGAVCGVCVLTHPAKTLTDEEIGELIGQYSHYENWEGFARAILRKASKK
jgi:hypothetical protein